MSLGPVMLDVEGLALTDSDRRRLKHPQTGGVILFSRNYCDPAQLKALVEEIHALRRPRLIVAVDQEGGRVQRFRDGFQRLPAMGMLGELYDRDRKQALEMAESVGWVMASELLHYGVDLSFAPVLDLGHKISSVIGDRALHTDVETIVHLANALIRGQREAGMEAVGKHFPGHGSVEGDSHHVMPFDKRTRDTILGHDVQPFRRVIDTHLAAVMMAHVIYEKVDPKPAGYSRYWIQDVLRKRLGFDGVVFSDDLSMAGAGSVGGYAERAQASLDAGCDMLLVCNNADGADEVLHALADYNNPLSQLRLVRLHGRPADKKGRLFETPRWKSSVNALQTLLHQAEISVSDDLFNKDS
jgi:beta-N-acetylhexosaminidase